MLVKVLPQEIHVTSNFGLNYVILDRKGEKINASSISPPDTCRKKGRCFATSLILRDKRVVAGVAIFNLQEKYLMKYLTSVKQIFYMRVRRK